MRITAQRTLDAAGNDGKPHVRGDVKGKARPHSPRDVKTAPTRKPNRRVSVAGTAKAATDRRGGKIESPQGSRLGTGSMRNTSPVVRSSEPPEFHCGRTGRRWPATPAPDESSLTAFTKSMPNRCITRKPGQGRDRKPHAGTGRSPSTGRVRSRRSAPMMRLERPSLTSEGMSRAKPAHIPPRRVGQDPTREAETEGVSVAGTAKAAGRPTGREDRSPQGSRLGTGSMRARARSMRSSEPPEFHCGRTGRRWPATPAPDESSLTAFTKSMPNRCITRKPGQGRDRKPHAEHRAQPEHRTGEDHGAAHP